MKNRTLTSYFRLAPKQSQLVNPRLAMRLFSLFLSVWFALFTCFGHPAFAQTSVPDFKAPIIEHIVVQYSNIGGPQAFEATVVDDQELDSVSLFYRFTNETEYTDVYTETEMQQLAQSSTYSVQIDTSDLQSNDKPIAIEYYIRAEDKGGNVVLKGFAFEPLVRQLEPRKPIAQQGSTSQTATVADTSTAKPRINWLYVALGVLVVGGIAASAGGSDTAQPPADCDPTCSVTLNFPNP